MPDLVPDHDTPDEAARLERLAGYDILDTPAETEFDEVVDLVAHLCATPIATITLVDRDRQWFKARIGLEIDQTPRAIAFCARTIQQDEPLIVPDARLDARFSDNPLVLGAPHIVFYAGFPLVSADGLAVGTLTAMDRVPRQLSAEQISAMKMLAHQVAARFELRGTLRRLQRTRAELMCATRDLDARVEQRTQELLRANEAHAYAERLYRSLVETTTDAVVLLDTTNIIRYANPSTQAVFGYSPEQLVGQPLATLQPERLRSGHQEGLRRYVRSGEKLLDWRATETVGLRADGSEVPIEIAFSEFELNQQRLFVGFIRDISERKRAAAELAYHQSHDRVTGLPHFAAIEDDLLGAFETAARRDGRVVLLYVDLDYFHSVNETRGRALGDKVLRTIAERLLAMAGEHGRVAHVAANEFAMILPDDGRGNPRELGDAVRAVVAAPVEIDGQRIYLTCSVGISCYPTNATVPMELQRQAEAAMVRSKHEGRNAVSVFSNDQSEELRIRLALGSQLQSAIAAGQLRQYLQPQINGLNWQVLGFEALARWEHPDLGLLLPKQFIQAAEDLGLIVDLGRFMLDEACRHARDWIDANAGDFVIAVNVSPSHLKRAEFVDDVRAALARHGVPARFIELELTESVMMDNVERMIGTMRELKAIGVRLALDDFGTGYSSLSYLRRFPIDCLKIDQSFVRDVTTDAGSAGICRAVITLAHQLGMQVLAEGIETAAQVAYLKRNHCDLFQGYYFGKALPADAALELLQQRYLASSDLDAGRGERTLLLVDDEANILSALTRALRRDGYRILTANSAAEALNILAREQVHVVVSDQRMPEISGTELLSKVKDMHPETVRIVLSGFIDLDAVTEAINQGAIYKFLTKPWRDEELRMHVQEAFRRHRLFADEAVNDRAELSPGRSEPRAKE